VTAPARNGHPGLLKEAFLGRILVDCPACGGLAVIRPEAEGWTEADVAFVPRRATCTRCSFHRKQETPLGTFARPAMGLPLRLVAEGRHGGLFAYNEDHLDYIESWVAAADRLEIVEPGGIRNRSVLSRLPAWVKAAANRGEVLRLIAKMRARLM
jgi:hypothetical protein